MSPNIRDLFADPALPESGGEDTEFDLDLLMQEADRALADRRLHDFGAGGEPVAPPTVEPTGEPTEPAPNSPPEPAVAGESDGGAEGDGGPGAEVAQPPREAPPAPEAVPSDPLAGITPERRAALLALDEYMASDPSARERDLRAMAPPEPEPVRPAPLPEHIDPGSFEAQLWSEVQEQKRLTAEIAAATERSEREREVDRRSSMAQQAGVAAGNTFSARYAGKLDQDDVMAIAQMAGNSGLAGRLATGATTVDQIQAAYDEALEHVLWKTEAYRTKVLGTAAAAPATPVAETPADAERKRKLHALSSAASPVAGAPSPGPSVQTTSDGRLTGESRMALVQRIAKQMAGRGEGTH